jgi:hypothetical protein
VVLSLQIISARVMASGIYLTLTIGELMKVRCLSFSHYVFLPVCFKVSFTFYDLTVGCGELEGRKRLNLPLPSHDTMLLYTGAKIVIMIQHRLFMLPLHSINLHNQEHYEENCEGNSKSMGSSLFFLLYKRYTANILSFFYVIS